MRELPGVRSLFNAGYLTRVSGPPPEQPPVTVRRIGVLHLGGAETQIGCRPAVHIQSPPCHLEAQRMSRSRLSVGAGVSRFVRWLVGEAASHVCLSLGEPRAGGTARSSRPDWPKGIGT